MPSLPNPSHIRFTDTQNTVTYKCDTQLLFLDGKNNLKFCSCECGENVNRVDVATQFSEIYYPGAIDVSVEA